MPFYATQILYNLHNYDISYQHRHNAKAGITGTPTVIDTGVVIVDETNYQYFMR